VKNYDTQIEAYLLGALDAAARKDFERAMQSDAGLAETVKQYKATQHRLWGMQLRKKVDRALADFPVQKLTFDRWRFWTYLATAVLLVAFFCFLYFRKTPKAINPIPKRQDPAAQPAPNTSEQTTEPIASAPRPSTIPPQKQPKSSVDPARQERRYIALAQEGYIPPVSDFTRSRKERSTLPTAIQSAIEAFSVENYQRVCQLLQDDARVGGSDESIRFLRGCARFKTGDYTGAGKDFLLLENSFQYRNEARWHQLLCTVAQGRIWEPGPSALLESMAADDLFPYQNRAIALKKGLRNK